MQYESDAVYVWLEQDWANWHGMPCFNEQFFTHTHVRNQSERLLYYYNILELWWPACRQNAREMFGMPGAAIAHGYLPPIRPDRYYHSHSQWEFSMEYSAQMIKTLWERYDYGGTEEMLKEIYPKLRDVAEFYSAYVTFGDDGYYHIKPTVVAEFYGWTQNMSRNYDTTSALCMFKWQLTTTAQAAKKLGVDSKLQKKWLHIAETLMPYPTFETPEGPVFSDLPGTNPTIIKTYNWYPGFYPTILADEITLDSPINMRKMMIRTAKSVDAWLYDMVLILMGIDDDYTGYQGFLHVSSEFYSERLLNSRGGRIHLWPAIKSEPTIAFKDFQARGGFEVSAQRTEGETVYLRIKAKRNERCQVMNPWHGCSIVVKNELTGKEVKSKIDYTDGECIGFEARAGCGYVVSKADNSIK
jgi:hypothetical protein